MKILIADDDELLRTLLEDFLTGLGHQVRSASDGGVLIKMALESRPDLVITDLHMPGLAGDSAIAMLDMYPDLWGLPVIAISGASKAELADMGIPKEIPILHKPFDFARIAIELKRVLQNVDAC